MMRELTVRELAERMRVTERTVYTWIKKGAVKSEQMVPGGHHRIAVTRPADMKKPETA